MSLPVLAEMVGASEEETRALIDAGCAPGVIYSHTSDLEWWSALAAYIGKAPALPPSDGENFYSPAAAWGLRRAQLHLRQGATPKDSTQLEAEKFHRDFAQTIVHVEGASLAYPNCFTNGKPQTDQITATAASEWQAWIKGAYGVCLRFFSGDTCIRKEALGARIKSHFEKDPEDRRLSDMEIIDLCQELASLVLPFAPWERPNGTPGIAIDNPLSALNLGREIPYGA